MAFVDGKIDEVQLLNLTGTLPNVCVGRNSMIGGRDAAIFV